LGAGDSCMPGTRRSTLAMIVKWISCGNEPILWLFGIVGTGKSAVMSSLFEIIDNHTTRLAAFIRFDRAEFSDAALFIRALAYQLAAFDSRLGHAISEAFLDRPQIINHPQLSEQFDVLIWEPLQKYPEFSDEGPIVILVDGLDECKGKMRKQLLDLLSTPNSPFKRLHFLRIIIASRPEEDIHQAFHGCALIHPFQLDTTSPEAKSDIEYFITKKLRESKSTEFWALCIKANAVSELSKRASGLFVWASVVVAFILALPHKRLRIVLDTDIPSSALGALDTLYWTALNSVVADIVAEDIQSDARTILGAIMVFSRLKESRQYPLTMPILITLLAYLNITQVEDFLDKLRSIMITFGDDTHNIQLMHKSLDDFLTDESRCGKGWYICLEDHYRNVASVCFSELFTLFENHTNAMWICPWPPITVFVVRAIYWTIVELIQSVPSNSILYKTLHKFFSIYFLRSWWVSVMDISGLRRMLSIIIGALLQMIVKPPLVRMSVNARFPCIIPYFFVE
jgi:hypothetical protein